MEYRDAYVAKIKKNTYDIISANTAFYELMGKRLYARFDELVQARHRERLEGCVRDGGSVPVAILLENGERQDGLAIMNVVDENITEVHMLLLDNVQEWEREKLQRISKKNALLSLYGDYYIEYDVAADKIRLYAADLTEQNIIQYSFEEFQKRLEQKIQEFHCEDISRMITSFREGEQHFTFTIPGDIFQLKGKEFTRIHGKAVYENEKYVYAVACVRLQDSDKKEKDEPAHALEKDYLTGVLTKGEITNLATTLIDIKKIPNITLAIIDIDYFKKVNDCYGHMMGDEVLKKIATVLRREVQNYGLVGRFGGDEFLVVFNDAYDMEAKREVLRSIKNTVASLNIMADNEEKVNITLSIGCAAYPKDADNYEDLFFLADFALYRAKEKGRNRYIIYDHEKHGTLEDIRNARLSVNGLDSHGIMSPAEFVCAVQDKLYSGQQYPLQKLLDDMSVNLNIQRIMLYTLDPCRLVMAGGGNRLSEKVREETQDYIAAEGLLKLGDSSGIIAIANVKRFETLEPELYHKLKEQKIISLLHIPFCDREGKRAILSLEYTDKIMTWNKSHFVYYRLLSRILNQYSLDETEME